MHHRTFKLAAAAAAPLLGGCSGMSRSAISAATDPAVGAVAGAAFGGAAVVSGSQRHIVSPP